MSHVRMVGIGLVALLFAGCAVNRDALRNSLDMKLVRLDDTGTAQSVAKDEVLILRNGDEVTLGVELRNTGEKAIRHLQTTARIPGEYMAFRSLRSGMKVRYITDQDETELTWQTSSIKPGRTNLDRFILYLTKKVEIEIVEGQALELLMYDREGMKQGAALLQPAYLKFKLMPPKTQDFEDYDPPEIPPKQEERTPSR
ncbi:hypothetical protein JW905_00095 [bacterium]|nr:hypothetical protein [candidate division CSSED10-310 bacterium]